MFVLIIALAPVLALVVYFYHKDKYEKEPLTLLFKAFLGGVVVTFAAIIIESLLSWFIKPVEIFVIKIFLEGFVVTALVEEGCKFFVLRRLVYNHKEFNEPYDGIMYAVMISLGFAALENIFYVLSALLQSGVAGVVHLGLVRGIFSVPAHAVFAVIMGYYLGLAKFTPHRENENKYIYTGVGLAVLAHGLYNFFLSMHTALGMLFMIILFVLCWVCALKAIKIQVEKSPFKD